MQQTLDSSGKRSLLGARQPFLHVKSVGKDYQNEGYFCMLFIVQKLLSIKKLFLMKSSGLFFALLIIERVLKKYLGLMLTVFIQIYKKKI